MAPAANIPEVDMSLTQKMDIQQSYWLLFDKMKDDFVGKDDLDLALKSATVNGGIQENTGGPIIVAGAVIAYTLRDTLARSKAVIYSKLASTGGVVRERAVEGLEAVTS
jgi:hypothetical protein